MIKQISVWKTVALTLVTLGTYSWVWFAKRRNEMVKSYKVSIPHWGWFVIPHALTLPLSTSIFLFPSAFYDPSHPMSSVIMPLLILLLLAISGFAFWWAWHFGVAVEKITEGRITLGWIFVYIFLLGPGVLWMLQYYFNRLQKTTGLEPMKYKPSSKFIMFSIVVVFIIFASWTASTVTFGLAGIDSGLFEF